MSSLLWCPRSSFWLPPRHSRLHQSNAGRSLKTLFLALWWLLLGIALLCCAAESSVFKVGVLGPWDCDPLFSKAFPQLAARLALERVSKDPSLHLGHRLDYVVLQEECDTPRALLSFLGFGKLSSAFIGPLNPGFCEVATLLGEDWNKAIFSWMCVSYRLDSAFHHPTFARTLPSPAQVLLAVMKHFSWAHVGIVASKEAIWMDTASKLASALRSQGLPVGIVTSLRGGDKGMEETWNEIQGVEGIKSKCLESHSLAFCCPQGRLFVVPRVGLHCYRTGTAQRVSAGNGSSQEQFYF